METVTVPYVLSHMLQGSNLPYSGRKLQILEGGIRAEGFISGPALPKLGIVKNTTFQGLMHAIDWLPTLAQIAGATPKGKPLDGLSQLGAFQTGIGIRKDLFLGYEAGPNLEPADLKCALRRNNWKIVRRRNNKGYYLYNLKDDPEEAVDLSSENTNRFRNMKKKLLWWLDEVGYYVQTDQCPIFDPADCGGECISHWNETFIRPWCD